MLFTPLKFQDSSSSSFRDIWRNVKNWKCSDTFGQIEYKWMQNLMKFCLLVFAQMGQKNLCQTETHRQADSSKVVKSSSKHPKTCKSIKNQKLNIFTKPILPSIYTEESKNGSGKQVNSSKQNSFSKKL